MARKLPWDRDQVDTPVKVERSPAQAPRSPVIATPASEPTKRIKRRSPARTRSPSTSPPPEPPKEEYMTPTDDLWQMVEDEFYQTAQKFTAHLHRAEYQRQKTLAASQNAAAISAIARPTVGEASRLVRQRSALTSRTKKQQDVLGEEVPATSGLRGLMDSPKKADRVLRVGGGLLTKAAAATKRAASPTPIRGQESKTARREQSMAGREISAAATISKVPTRPAASAGKLSSTIHRSRSEPNLKKRTEKAVELSSSDDDDDPFGIKRRRLQRAKSREQLRRPREQPREPSPDVIPRFF
ncbi:uncharacterized protein F5Z01DRAFT_658168 [Emericellopsis atlantica]|uniref:Uncharacterized protein n=1 Tax=Emericellopsis atlantica TaxID=2614577 RepID=A0A9P7ZKL2_9HYPO|nr:uncharacterized protein F5Z01DRAFT_658168 [Emericellopsis atlantica]KAG9253218.1 hypothetical protein F5Z01DRAFT_658168 [Emericellopsis atlantica]